MVDLAAAPTDDIIVEDLSGAATLEEHRWNATGSFLSVHQDPGSGTLTGPLVTTGLYLDPNDNAFYGELFSAPSGSSLPPKLVLSEVDADGGQIFTQSWTGSSSTEGVSPLVVYFAAGGDSGGGLHAPFLMGGSNPSIGDGVYCFASGGSFEGISGSSAVGQLVPGDAIWVTPGNNLAMLKPITATTDLGCGALTPSAGGELALAAFDTGGSCVWSQLLAVPATAVLASSFHLAPDGRMLIALVYSGTIDLGGGSMTSTGSSSLALAVYDGADSSSPTFLWAASFGGANSSFTLDSFGGNASGDTVVTAGYSGAVDLGHGPLSASDDTVIAAFDPSGALRWDRTVTVGGSGVVRTAVGSCSVALATTSPSVNLGDGAISTMGAGGVETIGVAALAL